MSIREVKAWTITCSGAYGNDGGRAPECGQKNIGPFFAEYQSDVPLPAGWGYQTLHDCGLTGYTRRDLWCGGCIAKHGIEVDAPSTSREG